jgi:O-antigen ligase
MRILEFLLGLSIWYVEIEPSPFEFLSLIYIAALFAFKQRGQISTLAVIPVSVYIAGNLTGAASGYGAIFDSLGYIAITLFLIVVALFIVSRFTEKVADGNFILTGFVIGALFCSFLIIAMGTIGVDSFPLDWQFAGRPKLFFKDPNVLGPQLVPAALVLFWLASKEKNLFFLRIYYFLGVLVSLSCVLTLSRAAWINLAIALLAMLFFNKKFRDFYKKEIVVLGGVILLIFLFGSINFDSVADNDLISILLARLELQGYDEDRFSATQQSLGIFAENLFGIGPGGLIDLIGMEPHNTYVKTLAEAGAFGAIGLLMLLVPPVIRDAMYSRYEVSTKTRDTLGIFRAVFLGLVVNAYVIDVLHWRIFWIVILGYYVLTSPKFATSNRGPKREAF